MSSRTITVCACGADSQKVTSPRAAGRAQLDADQFEELHVVPVRHPVQPVDQLVDHPGVRLDERDARIGDVVVGPLRAAGLNESLGVVDEILEVPVVEIGGGQSIVMHLRVERGGPAAGQGVRFAGDDVEREDQVARVVVARIE